jgi:diguanylate cyclase (GGDEF)-like protein/PAS domain S-box-containing protein
VVGDASRDDRFRDNPLVTEPDGIRFYAGVPLIVASGHCLGTLCVFDPVPRHGLTDNERNVLEDLAQLATDLIETRRSRLMGEIAAKVVEATSDAVLAADHSGCIVYWNAAAEKLFGWTADQALGHDVELIIPHRYKDIFARAARGGPARLVSTHLELPGLRSDGGEVPLGLSLTRWGDPASNGGFAAIARDISERKAHEAEKARAAKFLDSVVSNLPVMLFVRETQSRKYVMINRAAEEVLGRKAKDIIGKTDEEVLPHLAASLQRRDDEALASPGRHIHEGIYRYHDGRPIHLRTTRAVIDGPDGPDQLMLWVSEDVTEVKGAQAEINKLAKTDSLTGLLNRFSFAERLNRLTDAKVPFALLSIDLDRFKAVNDQFGHLVGDDILAKIAERIRDSVGPADWVARVGSDDFAAVLLGGDLPARAQAVADVIFKAIEEPVRGKWAVANVGACIGVALFPENGLNAEDIRQSVDVALYRAKSSGRGNICFFNAEMDSVMRDRRTLEKDLRGAIVADEIILYYQPILEVRSGRISSVEALARWRHPSRGFIAPDLFISMAEECGLVGQLGQHLLMRACEEVKSWGCDIRVAVNLSPCNFFREISLTTLKRPWTKADCQRNACNLR